MVTIDQARNDITRARTQLGRENARLRSASYIRSQSRLNRQLRANQLRGFSQNISSYEREVNKVQSEQDAEERDYRGKVNYINNILNRAVQGKRLPSLSNLSSEERAFVKDQLQEIEYEGQRTINREIINLEKKYGILPLSVKKQIAKGSTLIALPTPNYAKKLQELSYAKKLQELSLRRINEARARKPFSKPVRRLF